MEAFKTIKLKIDEKSPLSDILVPSKNNYSSKKNFKN